MSSSRSHNKGKAPMGVDIPQEVDVEEARRVSQLLFEIEGMEAYYISFKEKWPIIVEAQFDIDSFQADFPDIHNQFHVTTGPFKAQRPSELNSLLLLHASMRPGSVHHP
ncbi:hypothetical protein HAX54_036221 [Datura stramonium]|uniref:Uncharacterized protein n=1 Tax=Datura stramonium TaxID=4076 RepID=A0ABS8VJ87_DATST|nr:hypothetical protein [Datura stramonium]